MAEKIDYLGLRGLHKTLDDATEALAAFVSAAKSGEAPNDSLIEAADKAVDELAEWRETLRNLNALDAGGHTGERH